MQVTKNVGSEASLLGVRGDDVTRGNDFSGFHQLFPLPPLLIAEGAFLKLKTATNEEGREVSLQFKVTVRPNQQFSVLKGRHFHI